MNENLWILLVLAVIQGVRFLAKPNQNKEGDENSDSVPTQRRAESTPPPEKEPSVDWYDEEDEEDEFVEPVNPTPVHNPYLQQYLENQMPEDEFVNMESSFDTLEDQRTEEILYDPSEYHAEVKPSRGRLQEAIVWSEILGPCRAKQRNKSHLF